MAVSSYPSKTPLHRHPYPGCNPSRRVGVIRHIQVGRCGLNVELHFKFIKHCRVVVDDLHAADPRARRRRGAVGVGRLVGRDVAVAVGAVVGRAVAVGWEVGALVAVGREVRVAVGVDRPLFLSLWAKKFWLLWAEPSGSPLALEWAVWWARQSSLPSDSAWVLWWALQFSLP